MPHHNNGILHHVGYVGHQSSLRLGVLSRKATLVALSFLLSPPTVAALDPAAAAFTARPAAPGEEQNDTQSDVDSMIGLFDMAAWRKRGSQIRMSHNRAYCIGNLSLAVSEVGALASYSSQGASGALSLLPTAGALIGAPAKELWVLYKLTPVAGVLSMVLSLGGNIIPMQDADYEVSSNAFSYGGFIATHTSDGQEKRTSKDLYLDSADTFADAVAARAEENCVSNKRLKISIGILSQLFWLVVLMFACWMTQAGGVVAWWCQAWGWMYFWYLMVAMSSLLENFAGVPFTKQWTIRVSKAPKVRVSDAAPMVADMDLSNAVVRSQTLLPGVAYDDPLTATAGHNMPADSYHSYSQAAFSVPRRPLPDQCNKMDAINYVLTQPDEPLLPPNRVNSDLLDRQSNHSSSSMGHEFSRIEPIKTGSSHRDGAGVRVQRVASNDFSPWPSRTNTGLSRPAEKDILSDLDTGFNSTSTVFMDPSEPYTIPRTPFYVIISLKGISVPHATLRVISKAITVGVFAAGTATFASTTLLTISVALTTLCLVLGVGVFGRVAALWMASEMMKMDPVLHRVVNTREEAAEFIEAMLRKPGLVFEVMGHVIVNGRSVSRYNKWFRWSTLFGVLAPPFDISKIALARKQ